MFKKLLKTITEQRANERKAMLHRNLMRHEAQIGGQLFGEVQPGGRREFFCLDEHTWVWHEEWIDSTGRRRTCTTRYDVRPDSIIKSQNGQYQSVGVEEAVRLVQAARIYRDRVKTEVYSFVS
jgi:hypothetical protein